MAEPRRAQSVSYGLSNWEGIYGVSRRHSTPLVLRTARTLPTASAAHLVIRDHTMLRRQDSIPNTSGGLVLQQVHERRSRIGLLSRRSAATDWPSPALASATQSPTTKLTPSTRLGRREG